LVRSWFALRTAYDPHRPLDGGGGDPHQARVSTLMYLDAHGHHLGFPLSLAPSLRPRSAQPRPAPKVSPTRYRPAGWSGIHRKVERELEIAVARLP